jgi:hypothetical protein
MTVFCVNSGVTYADITAADAAESGIDYGTPTIFEQSGASTSAVVFSNADYPSSFIYRAASGQETDGTTGIGAQCTGQVTSSVVGHQFLDMRMGRINISFTGTTATLERLVINGTGGDPILFPASATAQNMTDVVVYNCSDAWRSTSTNNDVIATNCTAVDCTGFGFLRPRCVDTVSLNTGSAAYLQVGASSSNYWADDGTGSNAITESPTTDIFADYAGGDYRILASSSVGAAGAGAFIQSASGISVTEQLKNINVSPLNPSISLTGVISVSEQLKNIDISTLNPTVTLTSSISVTEQTSNVSYSALNPIVTLTGVISVTEQVKNIQFGSNNPVIDLTGVVSIVEQTSSYTITSNDPSVTLTPKPIEITEQASSVQYQSLNPSILLTPEPIGIVSTVCFPGCIKKLSFNGVNVDLSFNGSIKNIAFNGDLKDLEFNGTIKQNCTNGKIKTDC